MRVSSYLRKLERARDHLIDLKRRADAFFKTNPARIEGQYNADRSEFSFYFRVDHEPPEYMSLIIGDVLTNLAASLDHVIYEIAAKTTSRPEKTGFPIWIDAKVFKSDAGTKLKGLPKGVWDAVQKFQPYVATAKDPKQDPLWTLKTFNNWDKHQAVHVVVAQPMGAIFHPWIVDDFQPLTVSPIPQGPFKNGDRMAAFRIPIQHRNVNTPMTGELRPLGFLLDDVGLSPVQWFVIPRLEMMLAYVDDRVLPALAKFC